jgi:hypothetical protein
MLPDDNERVDTEGAAAEMTRLLGIHVSPKTLANQRARGVGLKGWKYHGTRPVITKGQVRNHVAHEALQDEHPRQRNARLAAELPVAG